jgi:hypothetical protein
MERLSELHFFDKMVETMKSFKAGTECTLKKPLFCPDNGETLKSATRYRELAEKRLDAEEQRYNLGLAGNEWLFQYQRDVANARVSEIKSIVDYKISVAKLEMSIGVSLKKKNIAFRHFGF